VISSPAWIAAAAQTVVAVAVVGGSPVGVRKDLVGLGRLLEFLLGGGVVLVDVGMQFAREPPEGLLDVGISGAAGDAEHLVVVTLGR
jgi:hypothetical protein